MSCTTLSRARTPPRRRARSTPTPVSPPRARRAARRRPSWRSTGARRRSSRCCANAPLHAAAAGGADAMLMGRLIAAGARVNHRQSSASMALHEAAAIGNADVVRLLLDSGAQPDVRNTEGQTPADLAREAGHAALADGLEAAARGRTP